MQVADGITFDTDVHIVPLANLGQAVQVIIGHVHAAGIACLPVDDHDFAVVAVHDVVDVGKGDGVELDDFDASLADGLEVLVAQRLVVRPVAEGVEHGAHFHSLGSFLGQQVEKGVSDGVVAEVEVFQVDMVARLADGAEQVGELLLSAHQQLHAVVACHGDAFFTQVIHHLRISRQRLRPDAGGEEEEGEYGYQCSC